MKKVRESIGAFCDGYPFVPALAAIIASSLPFLLSPEKAFSSCVFSALVFLLLSWGLLGTKRALVKVVPYLLPVLLSIFLRMRQDVPVLPEPPFGCEIAAVFDDPNLTGGFPKKIPAYPNRIRCRVLKFRYSQEDPWQSPGEQIWLVRLPYGKEFVPEYGDEFLLSGRTEAMEENLVPGAFNYRKYARIRAVSQLFSADALHFVRKNDSFLRTLYRIRGRILERLSCFMDERETGIASALLFGLRQGVNAEIRSNFLGSGTIHVLSVSGLHTGLFAGILLLFLIFLPYKIRYPVLLIPLFFYVLSTGMQLPAFRAFTMLAVWGILNSFLCRTSSLNRLGAAAVFLLLWNPLYLLDAGFEFSFSCVFFLLISRDFLSELNLAFHAKRKYSLLPSGRKPGKSRSFLPLLLVVTGLIAYTASISVSLYHQGIFSPAAVPAFLLLSPVAWFAFLNFVLALIFSFVPGSEIIFGFLLKWSIEAMDLITSFFADGTSFYTSPLSGWMMVIFLILLALFLLIRKSYVMILSGTGIALLIALALFRPYFFTGEETIVLSGSGRPMILLLSGRNCTILNAPDYERVRDAVSILHSRGITEIQELVFESPRKECVKGGMTLQKMMRIHAIRYAGRASGNAKRFRKTLESVSEAGGTDLQRKHGLVSLAVEENRTEFCSFGKRIILQTDPNRGITFKLGDAVEKFYPLSPNRNIDYFRQ